MAASAPCHLEGGGGEQGFADKTNGQTEETFESRDRVKALACRRISKPRKGAERNRPCAWRQRHDLASMAPEFADEQRSRPFRSGQRGWRDFRTSTGKR